jgi:hypothetical protein
MKALRFSDAQIEQIFRCAAPLAPAARSAFLLDIATALQGQELGDGLVLRTCREIQRRYWTPPDLSVGAAGRTSKYRR